MSLSLGLFLFCMGIICILKFVEKVENIYLGEREMWDFSRLPKSENSLFLVFVFLDRKWLFHILS